MGCTAPEQKAMFSFFFEPPVILKQKKHGKAYTQRVCGSIYGLLICMRNIQHAHKEGGLESKHIGSTIRAVSFSGLVGAHVEVWNPQKPGDQMVVFALFSPMVSSVFYSTRINGHLLDFSSAKLWTTSPANLPPNPWMELASPRPVTDQSVKEVGSAALPTTDSGGRRWGNSKW